MKIISRILDKMPYISSLRKQINEQGVFQAGHYYSPVPSKRDISEGVLHKQCFDGFHDIDVRRHEQSELLNELAEFYGDLPFSEKQNAGGTRYYYDQGWFCYSDSILLYCLIRKFAFKRIVEVGSGFSSAVMLDTLDSVGREDYKIDFIEPYPERLFSLVKFDENPRVALHAVCVQEADIDLFYSLEAGDLLFIDSSHVIKYRSDVNYLLCSILPSLKVGVIVHFHDIFYPFEYPDDWLKEGKYWNECYFLRAFLSGNKNWRIVLWSHYINEVMAEQMQRSMPLCRKNFGGSIYLQKIN
jgi:hypothetical protein